MVGRNPLLSVNCALEPSKCQITLPPRAESIVRVPVTPESPNVGMTAKYELQEGVYMAAALTKVVNGYALTSILNTNEVETDIFEPTVHLDEVDFAGEDDYNPEFEPRDREQSIMTQLRLDHLNAEERRALIATCSDFHGQCKKSHPHQDSIPGLSSK